MDILNCVQWIGSEWNVTEKGLVQNLGSRDISQIGPFGDMSDDITGMEVICEYTLRSVDICIFWAAAIFGPCCQCGNFGGQRFFVDIFLTSTLNVAA